MTAAPAAGFPRFRPVADRALLVEFGETVAKESHDRVIGLDAALAADPFDGFTEAVPAYASLLVCFDPVVTDHRGVEDRVSALIAGGRRSRRKARCARSRSATTPTSPPISPPWPRRAA